jgi:predicted GNAT family acetyltransferase
MDEIAVPADVQTSWNVLDNPAWSALSTTQASFAEGDNFAKRYPSDVVPFAALSEQSTASLDSLARLLGPGGVAGVILEALPDGSRGWSVIRTLRCAQMIWPNGAEASEESSIRKIEELGKSHVDEMLALVRLTKPGPFEKRTCELGSYLGIREAGQLVAMAGERFRPLGYTEISAVCTHPEYQGHGYASALISALVSKIIARREIPFLHVIEDNVSAIRLYLKLGFETRRFVNIAVLKRNAAAAS